MTLSTTYELMACTPKRQHGRPVSSQRRQHALARCFARRLARGVVAPLGLRIRIFPAPKSQPRCIALLLAQFSLPHGAYSRTMGLFSSLGELLSSSAFMGGLWLAILGAVGGTVVYAASKLVDLFSRCAIGRALIEQAARVCLAPSKRIVTGAVSPVWCGCGRYFIVRASVANTEDAFEWLVVWLANQKTVLSSKKLKLTTKKDDRHTVHRAGDGDSSGKMQLLPGNGTHLFSFKGKLIWMMRALCQPPCV